MRRASECSRTVMFTDIVSSTELLSAQGDAHWRHELDAHDRLVDRLAVEVRRAARQAHRRRRLRAVRRADQGSPLRPRNGARPSPDSASTSGSACTSANASGAATNGAGWRSMWGPGSVGWQGPTRSSTSRTVRDLSAGSGLRVRKPRTATSQGAARGHRGIPGQGRLNRRRQRRSLRLSAVITRMSELFLRTLRDDPADAEVPSHKLLIRAGYVRPIGPGLYSWLPLGLRVLRKIEQRRPRRDERHRRAGDPVPRAAAARRRTRRPTAGPSTATASSGCRTAARTTTCSGPTHEELFTLTVKGEYSSYKDFPLLLFQIQTKYRDEARPRAGILRGREFVMKDSYSFDVDDDGLKAAYHAHREAYQRIFDTLGVRYVIVSAVSGRDGRQRVGGVPGRKRGRRGHLRALPGIRIRRQRRGRGHRGARGAADRGAARGQGARHRRTPRPSPPWSTGPTARPRTARSPPPTR